MNPSHISLFEDPLFNIGLFAETPVDPPTEGDPPPDGAPPVEGDPPPDEDPPVNPDDVPHA